MLEEIYRKCITVDGITDVVELLDFNQNEHSSFCDQLISQSDGFILVYSVISRSSFDMVRNLKRLIHDVKGDENIPFILVGNKRDLLEQRQVPTVSGEQLALEWNAPFFETSAKSNEDIQVVFEQMVRLLRAKNPQTNAHRNDKPHRRKCELL
jgi:small GTP-binding protein